MAFTWQADGFHSQDFPTRVDAEAWLTASYEELLDDGVVEVSLYEDADPVYGPMSLLA